MITIGRPTLTKRDNNTNGMIASDASMYSLGIASSNTSNPGKPKLHQRNSAH